MANTPTTISNLQIWYDGADPNNTGTAPANSTAITTWKNKASTGSTYDAVATVSPNGGYGGNPATYNTTFKGLYFANNATYSTGSYPANPTTETAFLVFNTADNGASKFGLLGATTYGRAYIVGWNGATGSNSVGVLKVSAAWVCGTPSGSYVANTTGIATFKQSAGTAYAALYGKNGNAYSTGSTTYDAGTTTWLGAETPNPNSLYQGYAMEILIYNRVLSDSEITTVQSYLYNKWTLNDSSYYATSGGGGGTLPCFARGTRVLTQHGYKAIEMLEHNDYIVTPDSRVIDFKLFKTTVATTTKHTAPYLIQPHAFGHNVPSAPLRLSATHKIQLAEGLWTSPEKAALTNSLVTQCEIGAPVTYYHIECANYLKDNIVTEGMIVESLGTTKATGGKSDIYAWNSRLNAYTRVGHMDSPKSKSA